MDPLREWSKALMIAAGILLAVHVFLVRVVTVRNVSMYATLLHGDRVLVERWPRWTGFDRGDLVVFRDPMKDHTWMGRRPLMVKRMIGMPGDTVQIKAGMTHVNGFPLAMPASATKAYLVHLREGADAHAVAAHSGLPGHLIQPGRRVIELPLNEDLVERLMAHPDVLGAEAMGPARGAPLHLFPFTHRYQWNNDNYGPIMVPARGDTIRIDMHTLPLYDRLIAQYEGHTLSNSGDTLLMDGKPLEQYVVQRDYYFVLGDSRHHSADSRYWGFLPADHLVGRVGAILWRERPAILSNGE